MEKYKKSIIIIISFIVYSCDKTSCQNDLEKDNLKGNVISTKQTRYKVIEKFGEPVKSEKDCTGMEVCEMITHYNDLGNAIEYVEFDNFGISFITKIKRNEKNQPIEKNRYTPEEGKLVMQFKLKYDLNGNCVEESSDAGYLVKKEYDKNNLLKKELIKDWQTGKFNETVFFYNDNNQLIREDYNQGKTQYTYFDDGNIKEIIYFNKDGSIETKGKFKYQYDEHKNWIVQIAYEGEKPVSYLEREISYND